MSVKIEANDIFLKVLQGLGSASRVNVFRKLLWTAFLFELLKRELEVISVCCYLPSLWTDGHDGKLNDLLQGCNKILWLEVEIGLKGVVSWLQG